MTTTTIKQVVGTRTSLAFTGSALSTLASATYVQNTTAYDCTTNQPDDVVVDVVVNQNTGSPTGNKQAVVFIQESLDGTNYRTGPTSGTTTTREPNLKQMGVVPMTTQNTSEEGMFSVLNTLGFVPAKFFIVIKNDCGQAFTAGTVFTSEISFTQS